MNLAVVLVVTWITFGLELGLRDAFQLGSWRIAPSFVMILLTFISAWARRSTVLWTSMCIGIIADLLTNIAGSGVASNSGSASGDNITIVGPHALGFMLAGYAVYIMRAWMFRSSSLAVAVMSIVAAAIAAVFNIAMLKLRAAWDPALHESLHAASGELGQQMGSALYTGVLAIAFAPLLGLIRPFFRFAGTGKGQGSFRYNANR